MKYEIGDKVKIRDDLNDTEEYWMEDGTSSNRANDDMVRLKSKIRTIVDIDGGQYKLAGNDWHWTDEMIEGKVTYVAGTEYDQPLLEKWENLCKRYSYGAFTEPKTATEAMEEAARKERLRASWDEWKKSRRTFVWTTRDGESMLLSGMKTGHIQNALALLKRTNTPNEIKDGVYHSSWMEAFEKELQYREIKDVLNAQYGEHARDIVHDWLNKPQKENKENKEDIEMSNTQLIENKLEKELRALKKARNEEIKNKFYETSIGKAAKAFNEALERDGNENQKEYSMIDIDDLMERGEENFGEEINGKYDAKSLETKEYYAEAKNLFENADTYEQKHEILTSYGILKGPKAKAKVEVK